MPSVFQFQHTVREDEIDQQGHVNNLAYLRWMQDAAVAHSAAQGWTGERYRESGAGWVVRSHFIEYRQAAFAGESIEVHTWVANFKKVTSLRKYRIIRPADGAELAVAETDWAFLRMQHRVPRRIPPELRDAFVVVEGDALP